MDLASANAIPVLARCPTIDRICALRASIDDSCSMPERAAGHRPRRAAVQRAADGGDQFRDRHLPVLILRQRRTGLIVMPERETHTSDELSYVNAAVAVAIAR